ncbi:MAG: ribosome recycling factor [Anaerovoracaceae bacterium]
MSDQIQKNLEEKIEKSIEKLKEELNAVRAGRANPALLDRVEVSYYGASTPLKQLANISCPDPRTIMVTPFDPKGIGDIEHAIAAANVGINPVNDGKVIRLAVPQVTEERRKELTKTVKAIGEEAKVSVRNLRRHANDETKKEEKAGDLTEDDAREDLEDIQKAVDKAIKAIDEIVVKKDKEIMEV